MIGIQLLLIKLIILNLHVHVHKLTSFTVRGVCLCDVTLGFAGTDPETTLRDAFKMFDEGATGKLDED